MNVDSQEYLRINETCCFQIGGINSGVLLHCRFETFEEFLASKTANSDTCMLNPVIGLGKEVIDQLTHPSASCRGERSLVLARMLKGVLGIMALTPQIIFTQWT
jgi:hypothetical protein